MVLYLEVLKSYACCKIISNILFNAMLVPFYFDKKR